MAEPPSLEPRPALRPQRLSAPPGFDGGAPGVRLALRPALRQAVLAARRGQAAVLAAALAGHGVRLPPRRARLDSGGIGAVWIAPDKWLLDWEPREGARAARLFAAVAGLGTAVPADDARARFTVAGPHARDALAKMLTIDLHPRAFAPGDAAITACGDIGVIVWQVADDPVFECAVPRSLAGTFWDWLAASAAEYGVAVG